MSILSLLIFILLLFSFLAQKFINPLASPSAGAPALKYGDVNTVTLSPGEVKGLINKINFQFYLKK